MSTDPWFSVFLTNNKIYSYSFVKDNSNNIYVAGYTDTKTINIIIIINCYGI